TTLRDRRRSSGQCLRASEPQGRPRAGCRNTPSCLRSDIRGRLPRAGADLPIAVARHLPRDAGDRPGAHVQEEQSARAGEEAAESGGRPLMSALESNQAKAEGFLGRYREQPLGHFIGGRHERGTGKELIDNVSPIDGRVIGQVVSGDERDVDAAAQSAAAAFPAWRATTGEQRRAILHKVADAIEARREEIALVECVDTGQVLRFMSGAALRAAENFRFFADRAPGAADGLALPAAQHMNYTVRQPVGPVAVITPWNTPFMLSTWKIAPALAAGCTVVHKPAEWSPLTAMMLAEIMSEAGIPPGVVNVVNGVGERAGKLLTEHTAIRATAFIGESKTGSLIMSQGAPTLKRVHLELGGKNPVVVFDDADLDRALDAVVFMIYSLNGERCTSSSRLLVQRSIHDRFVAGVAERVARLKVGHPLDPASEVG